MKKIIAGISIAAVFWFLMFSPWTKDNFNFWYTMIIAASTLTVFSLILGRDDLKTLYKFKSSHILIGLASAAILYFIFYLGNYFSHLLFDFSRQQINNIYATKSQADKWFIGAALLFLIGPAEEIFWRGFTQHNFAKKYGDITAFILTTIVYAFVHIWAFNFMLFMAALICGIFWGWMFMRYKSIVPVIISHAVWDLVIFIILPISV